MNSPSLNKTRVNFAGQTVMITGGSKGIGLAACQAFLDAGARVSACSRRAESPLQQNEAFLWTQADVAHTPDVETWFARTIDAFGLPDVLLNNAGVLLTGSIRDFSDADWETIFAVNVKGCFATTRALFQHVSSRIEEPRPPRCVVNISSLGGVAGFQKFPGFAAYSASKGAVSLLTEALAEEGKEWNIRVNALAPGAVQTDMLKQAAPDLRSKTNPEDLAQAILLLAENTWAQTINGAVLPLQTNC